MRVAKLFTVFTLLLFGTLIKAQQPSWQWVKTAQFAAVQSIAADTMGNVYIAGYCEFQAAIFGSDTLNPGQGENLFLIKYNNSGQIVWIKDFAAYHYNNFVVKCDVAGNVYIGGIRGSHIFNLGGDTLPSFGGTDIFLAKYDSLGNYKWAKTFGSSYSDQLNSIDVDNTGNIYLAGNMMGSASIDLGNGLLANTGFRSNAFFAKYDTEGNTIWSKLAEHQNAPWVYDIKSGSNGNVYIEGIYHDSIDLGVGIITGGNTFLASFDASGNTTWSRSYNFHSGGVKMAIDTSNNIYLAGDYFSDSFTLASTHIQAGQDSGQENAYWAKFSNTGEPLWVKAFMGDSLITSFAGDIAIDKSGNLYSCGVYIAKYVTIDTDTLQGVYKGFVMKMNNAGNVIWTLAPTGSAQFGMFALCINNNREVFATGYLAGTFMFGNETVLPASMVLTKINNPDIETDVQQIPGSDINIYPNPSSSGTFNISGLAGTGSLNVYDGFGKLVYTSVINSPNYRLNLMGKAAGVYFYSITNINGSKLRGKIIIAK